MREKGAQRALLFCASPAASLLRPGWTSDGVNGKIKKVYLYTESICGILIFRGPEQQVDCR